MSELQTEAEPEQAVQPTEQQAAEPVETGAELATDSPEVDEENTSAAPAQDPAGYTKAINKQHRFGRDQQRRADAAEARVKELEAQHAPAPAKNVAVPDLLDPYDDGYAKSVSDRDDAIKHNARNDAIAAQNEEANVRSQRQAQIDAERANRDRVADFQGNAKRLGVTESAFTESVKSIVDYGVNDQIAAQMMGDPDGPLIAQYLAANPLELGELNNADPFKAGQMWGDVKAKASALKPTATKAPTPATSVSGGGKAPGTRGAKGSSFE